MPDNSENENGKESVWCLVCGRQCSITETFSDFFPWAFAYYCEECQHTWHIEAR